MLPDALARQLMQTRPGSTASAPCTSPSTLVRRGGTISLSGVYGGSADPDADDADLFDKQIQLRMGQANVKRWVDDIMPLLSGRRRSARRRGLRHPHLPLDAAPHAYEIFQKKQDGAIKILLQP